MTQQILAEVRQVYRQVLPDLLQRRNVVACGLGYKISQGQPTSELSLIVSVVQKVPREELSAQDLIPQAIGGLLTDVVETGRIRALMADDPKARRRPAPPGVSVGHHDITAGTFGLLVHRGGDPLILSNNHVLANSNQAKVGDPIYQPGPADGGTAADKIATLADFMPIDFGQQPSQCQVADSIAGILNALAGVIGSSHRLQTVQQTPGTNSMDAALARPDSPELVIPEILGLGRPVGTGEPRLGLAVQKMGRTTGLTQGMVTQIDVTVNVDYGGRVAYFTDQIITGNMSSPGDSGSGILDMNRNVVGLLFAGSDQVTIFTPIQRILEHFGVEVVV